MEMKAPPNLYGSTLLVPMMLNRKDDGLLAFVLELVRTYTLIIVSYTIQFIFLQQVWILSLDSSRMKSKCSDESLLLQCVCVFTFEAAAFYGFRDSINFASFIIEAPVKRATNYAQIPVNQERSGGAILDKEETGTKGVMFRMFGQKGATHQAWTLNGMSRWYQIFSFVTLAMPQIVISASLSWIGGDFISSSEDKEALIMNTVGVLFISQLGETIYHAFTSSALKEDIQSAKGIQVDISNKVRWSLWVMSVFFPALVLVYTTIIVFGMKLHDCRHYTLPF